MQEASIHDVFDHRTWENLDNKGRDILIEKGPVRELNLEFPAYALNRHASAWDSGVCYSCRLLFKCFSCLSNPLNYTVTVASAERSFSKLKLLKNYLRSTMSQERLNGLAMCTIDRDILDTIDLNTVLDDFASINARRTIFLWKGMYIMEFYSSLR